MHDSFMPIGGMIPMLLMQFGEVIFGGVGSGLYGMLVFALLAVFVAGLMIGRTPEYLGKKIEAYEMKMASLAVLVPAALILIGTAVASVTEAGTAPLGNPGAHGFSEILYAFTSAAGNNGSAFAGISANTSSPSMAWRPSPIAGSIDRSQRRPAAMRGPSASYGAESASVVRINLPPVRLPRPPRGRCRAR